MPPHLIALVRRQCRAAATARDALWQRAHFLAPDLACAGLHPAARPLVWDAAQLKGPY
ncbi:hypothetical protein [Nocardia panacis]|uniref:hypothetical protein n=1 Tax=Nocardia panacis TaxID=2340916 RepID=UPI00131545AA|nr:hypothetical protein [Nocardia panacis]